jgi:hypothetical protein
MTEQDKSGPNQLPTPRRLDALDCAVAELLVHRRLLTKLITTVTPALFGPDGVEQAKRDLHAMVVADLDRARFLGSSTEKAEAMRSHANAILDQMLIGAPPRSEDGN